MPVVAIHQPNFLPWLGYFAKFHKSDLFVLLDNAQFQKTGGGYMNRVKLLISGQPQWVTVPVLRPSGLQLIHEVVIADSLPWREKTLRAIAQSYSKHAYYAEVMPIIERIINYPTTQLMELNLFGLKQICELTGLSMEKTRIASDYTSDEQDTERLVAITAALKGEAYLCGDGSDDYLEQTKFDDADIGIKYMNFKHPVYQQGKLGEFHAGLSILDALFNIGPEATRRLLG